jgi:peptide/nickel transport system permease protein
VDAVIMWLVNIIWSIPTLLLVIAITLALRLAGFVAVGLTMWVEVARVVRGQVISVKEMQYVTARALGFGDSNHFNHIHPYHGASYCYLPNFCISYISGKRFKLWV